MTAMTPEPTAGASASSVVPGLVAIGAATALAFVIADLLPGVNASTAAVVLGALAVNLGLHRPALRPGTRFASKRLLRIAVVLLGLQLGLSQLVDLGLSGVAVVIVTVTVTFGGTRLIGRAIGLPSARTLLIATGFSICGASAVAAMEQVAGGDEDDTGVAIALVTLCGSLAIFLLPALRGPLGLDVVAFGSWVGASVHDVGQTVATAQHVEGSLNAAVVVKLSRVVLLAPLVAGMAVIRSRPRSGQGAVPAGFPRPPLVPLFVAGFLATIALTSTGILPAGALSAAKRAQEVLLAAALVALGTGIYLPTLKRTGGRALVLGLASWLLVATVSYTGVRLLGR